jgi:hypothetical protein
MRMHGSTRWALGLALVLGSAAAMADDAPQRPRAAPPEAIQACSGAQEGGACEFTMGDRALSGTCRTGPDGQAACLPPHPHGPPPEAFQACQGLTAGASCSVTFHDQTMGGTCRTGPDGKGALACAPARMPAN